MLKIQHVDVPTATLSDPDASLWHRVPNWKVDLIAAPVAMQPSKYVQSKWRDGQFGQLRALGFQVLHNGIDMALRLEWRTEVPPRPILDDNDHFPDAAALLFPMHDHAPIFMGGEGMPVSIWHWKANGGKTAIANVAEGIGTSRALPEANIAVNGQWRDGHWQVVFCRSLMPDPTIATQPRFLPNEVIRVGFAVWNGSRQERAGLKTFSPVWTEFTLAP